MALTKKYTEPEVRTALTFAENKHKNMVETVYAGPLTPKGNPGHAIRDHGSASYENVQGKGKSTFLDMEDQVKATRFALNSGDGQAALGKLDAGSNHERFSVALPETMFVYGTGFESKAKLQARDNTGVRRVSEVTVAIMPLGKVKDTRTLWIHTSYPSGFRGDDIADMGF